MTRACLVAGLLALLPAASSARQKAWVLHQSMPLSPFTTAQTVIVSGKGVKVAGGARNGFVLDPDYVVSYFDDTSRQCFEAPYEELGRKYGVNKVSPQLGKKLPGYLRYVEKTDKHRKIAGLNATLYLVRSIDSDKVRKEVWLTQDLKIPRKAGDFLCATVGLPPQAGVPVELTQLKDERGKITRDKMLETLTAEQTTVSDAVYKKPAGYKRVKEELSFMLNNKNTKEDLTDLMAEPAER